SGVKLDGTRQQGLNRERTTLDRNDFSIQSVFLEEVQVLCDPKRQQLAAQAGAGNANWCAIRAGKHCRGRQYNHKAEQNSSHVALLELRALSASLSRDRKIVERWISGPALNRTEIDCRAFAVHNGPPGHRPFPYYCFYWTTRRRCCPGQLSSLASR